MIVLPKVELRTNLDYTEIHVDGKRVIGDDGINTHELVEALSKALGFEYEYVRGDWNRQGEWKPRERG